MTSAKPIVDKTTSIEQLRARLARERGSHCPIFIVLTDRGSYLIRQFAVFFSPDGAYLYHRTRQGTLMSTSYPQDPSSFTVESEVSNV
jgi:hypothetical protein